MSILEKVMRLFNRNQLAENDTECAETQEDQRMKQEMKQRTDAVEEVVHYLEIQRALSELDRVEEDTRSPHQRPMRGAT